MATDNWSYSSNRKASDHWIYVFRAKDKETRLKIAQAMLDACANNYIGYDQNKPDRYTFYDEAKKVNWKIKKVKTKCETTCSNCATTCLRVAGIPAKYAPRVILSRLLVNYLKPSGLFYTYTDGAHCKKSLKLQPGDILVSKRHTAIVVKSPHLFK